MENVLNVLLSLGNIRFKSSELDGGAIESDLERIQKTFSRSPTYNAISP